MRRRVAAAVRALVARGDVGAVCLGCAGMVGLDEVVREAAGEGVVVVDGVAAGVRVLLGLV